MSEKNEIFFYNYSAKEQSEIKAIREKYVEVPEQDSKLAQLKKLDKSVQSAGRVPAVIVGILGTLTMGVGMCCTMVWQGAWFIPGIFIGSIGILGIIAAYPLNNLLVKRRKKQAAPQIIALTDELMK